MSVSPLRHDARKAACGRKAAERGAAALSAASTALLLGQAGAAFTGLLAVPCRMLG